MGIIAMAVLLGRQEVLDAQNVLQKQIQVPSITPSYTLKTLESLKVTTARIEEEDLDEAVVDLAEAEEVVEVEAEEVDVQDEAPDVVDRDPTTPPTLMEVELTTPPRREKEQDKIRTSCISLQIILCILTILAISLLSCHYHTLF
jgi:hypothetical protein